MNIKLVDEDHICDTDGDSDNNTTESNIISTRQKESDCIDRLIAEVFIREPLWNSKLPYKQRGPKDIKSLWAEVDASLGVDPGTSQSKWKNLRDRFVKENSTQNAYTASGSAAKDKKTSSWYLYETLSFLKPTIIYRKTKSNLENMNPNPQSISLIGESSFPSTSTQEHLSQRSIVRPQSSERKSNEVLRKRRRYICLLLLYKRIKKMKCQRSVQRKYWIHPILQRKQQQGDWYNLIQEMRFQNDYTFFSYMRMTPIMFDYVLAKIIIIL